MGSDLVGSGNDNVRLDMMVVGGRDVSAVGVCVVGAVVLTA